MADNAMWCYKHNIYKELREDPLGDYIDCPECEREDRLPDLENFFQIDNKAEYLSGALDCVMFVNVEHGEMFFNMDGVRFIKLTDHKALSFHDHKEYGFDERDHVYFWGNDLWD